MPILTLAAKDLRLLLRDPRSTVVLLGTPLILILVIGLTLGELFGQKPDDRLRVSVVNLDKGLPTRARSYPTRPWSEIVIDDLSGTAGIRVEIIESRETAERLVSRGERSAVLVFDPEFSERLDRCSFLTVNDPPPLNPLFRDGVRLEALGLIVLRDPTQQAAASIIEQVAQVTLLRVVIPYMIGNAFERVGDDAFIDAMGKHIPGYAFVPGAVKSSIGPAVKAGIATLFSNYNFTAKTWAGLTKAEERAADSGNRTRYDEETGLLKRGAIRYQVLVPSYTVLFAFSLVLTVGWLFVAERRHGTLVRLRAAPLTRGQILLGKLLPCLAVSLFQGLFLLLAGRLVFGMNWGPRPDLLLLVVFCTSLAAVGMAMLVASVAKTETQVAVYGTLLVLVLGAVSGSLLPRDFMPESMRQFSQVTPHAWALDAYSQLLTNPTPEIAVVIQACAVLTGFGAAFLALAWWRMDLE